MADTFQNEVPKARINLKLALHTGGVQKKVELPLKFLAIGDFSNGKEDRPLSERAKINVNKNNFNSVLSNSVRKSASRYRTRWPAMAPKKIFSSASPI